MHLLSNMASLGIYVWFQESKLDVVWLRWMKDFPWNSQREFSEMYYRLSKRFISWGGVRWGEVTSFTLWIDVGTKTWPTGNGGFSKGSFHDPFTDSATHITTNHQPHRPSIDWIWVNRKITTDNFCKMLGKKSGVLKQGNFVKKSLVHKFSPSNRLAQPDRHRLKPRFVASFSSLTRRNYEGKNSQRVDGKFS